MTLRYISYFDNVLPKELCDAIINKFEDDTENQKKTFLENHRSFTEINLTQHTEWKLIQDQLMHGIQSALPHYIAQWSIDKELMFPKNNGWEQLRMKRYLPNEDDFKFHVDVQDYASARRFLVAFYYLNDVEEGGETAFQSNRGMGIEFKVQPKAGRLIFFPPMWTYPHIGMMPISGPKYIVGTYLHYV